jgi:predicted PurR-regulated permease PerM
VITLCGILIFVVATLLIIPTMIRQTTALVEVAPDLARRLEGFLTTNFPSLMEEGSALRQSIASLGKMVSERGGEVVNGILSTAFSLINVVLLLVIVPVVAVYMLLDWDNMVARIDAMVPRDHVKVIRRLAREIDHTLAAFIRGQGTVCLILGTFYAVALMLTGLQFGLVIGALAGLLVFIPYLGAIIGGVLSVGLALYQFWGEWYMIAIVAGIFVFGQFIEGNFLTPKLVGSSIGLHPVWLIFALSAFGALFGFVGLLVAVPVAAAIGVIARFVIERYTDSRLYQGTDSPPNDVESPDEATQEAAAE